MKPDWCDEKTWATADHLFRCSSADVIALTLLKAHQRGRQEGMEERPVGLSQWSGWDQSRLPWSECKHKDAVLEALFLGPWSVEDAACLTDFIERMWGAKMEEQP